MDTEWEKGEKEKVKGGNETGKWRVKKAAMEEEKV